MQTKREAADYQQITTLSDREEEVVKALLTGLAAKEIAEKCFISRHTVNTHLQRIRYKLNAKNNVDVAVKYLTRLKNPSKYLKHFLISVMFLGAYSAVAMDGFKKDLRKARRVRITKNTRTLWKQ